MNLIEKLITKYCPSGIKFRELWEITIWDRKFNGVNKIKQKKVLSFKHISAKNLKKLKVEKGDIKLISTGKFDGWTNKSLAKTNINEGEIIAISSGGSANLKYFKGNFIDSGNILASSLNDNFFNLKFCYYFLLTKNDLIESYFRGAGIKHPSMIEILKIKIPIPPLLIQKEIVKILDKFNSLIEDISVGLPAEINARRKQYKHYQEKLLLFKEKNKRTNYE